MNRAILLISCPDQKGITAALTNFVYEHNGNIMHADQHIDEQSHTFFMRLEWSLEGFALGPDEIAGALRPAADRFLMNWQLFFTARRPRVAIFVSRHLHVLQDLLDRVKTGQLACDVPLVISNHSDAKPLAEAMQIPYHVFPVTPENKAEQEAGEIALLEQHEVDLILLARYHQVLTGEFVGRFPQRIINIHHSFLPAFPGRRPYAQAFAKGVKIIGATSHYVNEELDQGPIIEQDTVRVSHRDCLADLVRKGEDLEKAVMSRTVRWAIEHKILSYLNKTVVFD